MYNVELKLPIGGVFPLERCDDAHRALEGRGTIGKLLLEVDGTLDSSRA